ncbi:homeobox protein knotted-1-like 1 [Sesamum indicum]|uniref:Homeobox protein knotted-1-like 1 n=1 Tax=Sesamum indicum TaxID=4182 RepID=A0A6I9TQ94_SESIN|nr:homeobox protein knotted-1-like 1 [Sesamum indicum]
MERKEEKVVQESSSNNITINGDDDECDNFEEEGFNLLKREIASHSLYALLLQSHLDCLKLCLGNVVEKVDHNVGDRTTFNPNHPNLRTSDHQSELDQFMEAYCMTLKKVKEVMEEPQQESMAFINYMYSQLEELLLLDINPPSSPIN